MKPVVLWVVGAPGVGKTTAIRHVLSWLRGGRVERTIHEKPKWTEYWGRPDDALLAVAAGHYTGDTFDGADRVPYNGVSDALEHWKRSYTSAPLTIFDGDRFSHAGAFDFFGDQFCIRACVLLTAHRSYLSERRAARGSHQNEAWTKGRETKADRFYSKFNAGRVIAANEPASVVAGEIARLVRLLGGCS